MTKAERAAYQREYRYRQKYKAPLHPTQAEQDGTQGYIDRIAQLEAEVKHLKAELAKRAGDPAGRDVLGMAEFRRQTGEPTFNSRPFTPAPKKGK